MNRRDAARAMSQENVEIVRRAFEAFDQDGIEEALPRLAPDNVVHALPEWPGPSEYRGHDGIRALMTEWTESFDDFHFEIGEIRELRDRCCARRERRADQGFARADPTALRGPLRGLPQRSNRRDQILPHLARGPRSRRAVGVGNPSTRFCAARYSAVQRAEAQKNRRELTRQARGGKPRIGHLYRPERVSDEKDLTRPGLRRDRGRGLCNISVCPRRPAHGRRHHRRVLRGPAPD